MEPPGFAGRVGQVVNLRAIGNRPTGSPENLFPIHPLSLRDHLPSSPPAALSFRRPAYRRRRRSLHGPVPGRLPIGRRLPTCPTRAEPLSNLTITERVAEKRRPEEHKLFARREIRFLKLGNWPRNHRGANRSRPSRYCAGVPLS